MNSIYKTTLNKIAQFDPSYKDILSEYVGKEFRQAYIYVKLKQYIEEGKVSNEELDNDLLVFAKEFGLPVIENSIDLLSVIKKFEEEHNTIKYLRDNNIRELHLNLVEGIYKSNEGFFSKSINTEMIDNYINTIGFYEKIRQQCIYYLIIFSQFKTQFEFGAEYGVQELVKGMIFERYNYKTDINIRPMILPAYYQLFSESMTITLPE